jgi:hypothetical protein
MACTPRPAAAPRTDGFHIRGGGRYRCRVIRGGRAVTASMQAAVPGTNRAARRRADAERKRQALARWGDQRGAPDAKPTVSAIPAWLSSAAPFAVAPENPASRLLQSHS